MKELMATVEERHKGYLHQWLEDQEFREALYHPMIRTGRSRMPSSLPTVTNGDTTWTPSDGTNTEVLSGNHPTYSEIRWE